MNVDRVDRIEDVLRTAALLVPVRKLADGHGDVQAGEVLLREDDLLRELGVREDVVEKRLRPELEHARDELRFGIRVEGGEKCVAAPDPDVVKVETELWTRKSVIPIGQHRASA